MANKVTVMHCDVIQQLGSPEEIHDKSASLFVALFIRTPTMNLVQGTLRQSRFEAAPVHVDAIEGFKGPDSLGVWSEDTTLVRTCQGGFHVLVDTVQINGENVQVTLDAAATRIAVKPNRVWRAKMAQRWGSKLTTRGCTILMREPECVRAGR